MAHTKINSQLVEEGTADEGANFTPLSETSHLHHLTRNPAFYQMKPQTLPGQGVAANDLMWSKSRVSTMQLIVTELMSPFANARSCAIFTILAPSSAMSANETRLSLTRTIADRRRKSGTTCHPTPAPAPESVPAPSCQYCRPSAAALLCVPPIPAPNRRDKPPAASRPFILQRLIFPVR